MDRRSWLRLASGFPLLAPISSAFSQPVKPAPPKPDSLLSGDLLWPKRPGAYVPYRSEPSADYEAQKREWTRERDAFVRAVRANAAARPEEVEAANRLEKMTFAEFLRLYESDHDAEYEVQSGGSSPLYVGHVAIVERAGDNVSVIEATGAKGVSRMTYAAWIAGRPQQIFWHGRVIDGTDQQRAAIAAVAAQYLGVPYSFWDFDLSSVTGFYCSKLAWWSIFQALKIAVDDKPNPKRTFWFSPKQLMKCKKHVRMLTSPGTYAID